MAVSARTTERRRVRARVAGVVQGVGFRPYVFRLAEELGLGGWVLNDERGSSRSRVSRAGSRSSWQGSRPMRPRQ